MSSFSCLGEGNALYRLLYCQGTAERRRPIAKLPAVKDTLDRQSLGLKFYISTPQGEEFVHQVIDSKVFQACRADAQGSYKSASRP